jgi:hypothetical protein
MLIALRHSPDTITKFVSPETVLRMYALAFVILAVTFLAAIDALSAEASTLLAAISGYVLGGIKLGHGKDSSSTNQKHDPGQGQV